MSIGDVISRLSVSLSLETAAFEKGSGRAKKEVSGLQSHMSKAGKAIGAAFVGMLGVDGLNQFREAGRAALNMADEIGESAVQIGVGSKALQDYRFIASQVGIEQTEMDGALTKLTRSLGDAATGAKAPAKAFEALGVSIRDSQGNLKSTEEVMLAVADGMKNVKDPAIQASLAVDLFGKSGQKLAPIWALGSQGIREYANEAQRLGIILSEETIAKAGATADELVKQDQILAMRKNKLFSENAEAVANTEKLWQNAQIGFYKAVTAISNFFQAWTDGAAKLQARVDAFDASISAALGRAWQSFENWWQRTQATANAFVAFWAALPGRVIGYVQQLVTGVGQWLGTKLSAVFDGVKQKIAGVEQAFAWLYDRVVGNSWIPDMVDGIKSTMAGLDAALVQPVNAATTEAEKKFRALQERVSAIMDRLFPDQRAQITYETERKDLQEGLPAEAADGAVKALDTERLSQTNAYQTASAGLGKGFAGLVSGFEQAAQVMEQRAEMMRDNVTNTFESMVQGALGAIQNLIGAIKHGGFLDILGAIAGVAMEGFKIYNSFGGARAAGGPVLAGKSYLVGERGPEMFTPRSSGLVIPNHDLGLVPQNHGSSVLPRNNQASITRVEIVDTTGLFVTRVNGIVQPAAIAAAQAGTMGGVALMQRRASRRFA